jgi:transposase InsO family protein
MMKVHSDLAPVEQKHSKTWSSPPVLNDLEIPCVAFALDSVDSKATIKLAHLRAIYDTGAQVNVIDRQLVEDLGLLITPAIGIVSGADSRHRSHRIGTTVADVAFVHSTGVQMVKSFTFDVLPADNKLTFGLCAGATLGISVVGLPHRPPSGDLALRRAPPQARALASPQFINLPDCETDAKEFETSKFASMERLPDTDVAFLLAEVQATLAANAALPRDSFCTHPDSIIRLDLLPGTVPCFKPPFVVAHALRPALALKIVDWDTTGVIVPAPHDVLWNSSLLPVSKRDIDGRKTATRWCLDPRHINACLPDNPLPVPNIAALFERLTGFVVATALDMMDSYHQFRIFHAHQHILSFTWNGKRYMFARAPFGLKILTQVFQSVMEKILVDHLDYVLIYVDDIIIFTVPLPGMTHAEVLALHARQLNAVVATLTAACLRLKIVKCHIGYVRLPVLGFLLSGTCRWPDPDKIRALSEWPVPLSAAQLQAFLGFANYLRDFIVRFAERSAPLDVLRNSKAFLREWDASVLALEAFHSIRSSLVDSVPLEFPLPGVTLCVACDASQYGLGAVLFQDVPVVGSSTDTKRRFICFASKALTAGQKNYSATLRELTAIIFALQRFRVWLWGTPFHLYTDHRPLTFFHTQKELKPMVADWLDVLLDYTFVIFHLPGIDNILPDALSRSFPPFLGGGSDLPASSLPVVDRKSFNDPNSITVSTLRQLLTGFALSSDTPAFVPRNTPVESKSVSLRAASVGPIISVADDDSVIEQPSIPVPSADEDLKDLVPFLPIMHPEPVLYPNEEVAKFMRERASLTLVPESDRKNILLRFHNFDHFGAEFLFKKIIKAQLYWPGMRSDCDKLVDRCVPCIRFNVGKRGFHPQGSVQATFPWEHVAIDTFHFNLVTAAGFKHVLVIVCVATGFVVLRPLTDLQMVTLAAPLWEVFSLFGFPKILQSDNGTEFCNSLVAKLTWLAEIEHRFIASWNPRCNGKAESSVGLAKAMLLKMAGHNMVHFDCYLNQVQLALNLRIKAGSHKSCPFDLMYAREHPQFADLRLTESAPLSHMALLMRNRAMVELFHPILRSIQEDELHALNFFEKYADQRIGFTDCLSFVVMEERGITEALTTDEHFQQAGFRALLRETV